MLKNYTLFQLRYLRFVLLLLTLNSCNYYKSTKKVDVSSISVNVQIDRLEKDLYQLHPNNLVTELPVLKAKYPDFLPYYLGKMMGFGDIDHQPELTTLRLQQFLTDTTTRFLMDTTIKTYQNIDFLQKGLEEAFKHYKYYFPSKKIPKVITFVSYFGWGNITYDSTVLGIGLDMYLGKDFSYPEIIPAFLKQTFTKDYIVPNSMKVLASMNFDLNPADNKLLTTMVNNGKQLYFADLMLPETADYLKIGYRKQDIDWCFKNEPEIWQFFVSRQLLYSTNATENSHYVTEGPNTSGMPKESPGNIGSWVGWQIVRHYMDEHPETKLQDLMKMDAQQILSLSKYKPKHSMI